MTPELKEACEVEMSETIRVRQIDGLNCIEVDEHNRALRASHERIDELEAQRKQSNIEINDLKLDNFQLKCAFDDKCDELREVKAQLAEAVGALKQINGNSLVPFKERQLIFKTLDSLKEKGGE